MQMVDLFKPVPGHLPLWDIIDTDAGLPSRSAPVSMIGLVSADEGLVEMLEPAQRARVSRISLIRHQHSVTLHAHMCSTVSCTIGPQELVRLGHAHKILIKVIYTFAVGLRQHLT